MHDQPATGRRLRCELFVTDLDASRRFYTEVLGFTPAPKGDATYLPLTLGALTLSIQDSAALPPGHHFDRASLAGRRGVGVELVLEVDDLAASYRRLLDSGWPRYESIVDRPWGLRDFRVIDPDGYYLRVNEPED
ncbi:hypothetical protein BH24ACT3_BH24ACT3_02460 [soil metagenome]